MTGIVICARSVAGQVVESKRSGMAEAQLTLPKWDFGRLEQRKGGTIKAARHMRSLRSHQISALTLKSDTVLGTQPLNGSPPHQAVRKPVPPRNADLRNTSQQPMQRQMAI